MTANSTIGTQPLVLIVEACGWIIGIALALLDRSPQSQAVPPCQLDLWYLAIITLNVIQPVFGSLAKQIVSI